ncbi:MAG: hypothetical protein AB7E85_00690 [Pseudobdellovibrionaceae bacterium]
MAGELRRGAKLAEELAEDAARRGERGVRTTIRRGAGEAIDADSLRRSVDIPDRRPRVEAPEGRPRTGGAAAAAPHTPSPAEIAAREAAAAEQRVVAQRAARVDTLTRRTDTKLEEALETGELPSGTIRDAEQLVDNVRAQGRVSTHPTARSYETAGETLDAIRRGEDIRPEVLDALPGRIQAEAAARRVEIQAAEEADRAAVAAANREQAALSAPAAEPAPIATAAFEEAADAGAPYARSTIGFGADVPDSSARRAADDASIGFDANTDGSGRILDDAVAADRSIGTTASDANVAAPVGDSVMSPSAAREGDVRMSGDLPDNGGPRFLRDADVDGPTGRDPAGPDGGGNGRGGDGGNGNDGTPPSGGDGARPVLNAEQRSGLIDRIQANISAGKRFDVDTAFDDLRASMIADGSLLTGTRRVAGAENLTDEAESVVLRNRRTASSPNRILGRLDEATPDDPMTARDFQSLRSEVKRHYNTETLTQRGGGTLGNLGRRIPILKNFIPEAQVVTVTPTDVKSGLFATPARIIDFNTPWGRGDIAKPAIAALGAITAWNAVVPDDVNLMGNDGVIESVSNYAYYRFDWTFWNNQPDTIAYIRLSSNFEAKPQEVGQEIGRVQELIDSNTPVPSYLQRAYSDVQTFRANALQSETSLIGAENARKEAEGAAQQAEARAELRELDADTRDPNRSLVGPQGVSISNIDSFARSQFSSIDGVNAERLQTRFMDAVRSHDTNNDGQLDNTEKTELLNDTSVKTVFDDERVPSSVRGTIANGILNNNM